MAGFRIGILTMTAACCGMLCACLTTSIYQDERSGTVVAGMERTCDPHGRFSKLQSLVLQYESAHGDVITIAAGPREQLYYAAGRKGEKKPRMAYGLSENILRKKLYDTGRVEIDFGPERLNLLFFYNTSFTLRKNLRTAAWQGEEQIDGRLCDRVKLEMAGGFGMPEFTMWADRKTGERVRLEYVPDVRTGKKWVSSYADFKEYEGLRFPSTVCTEYLDLKQQFKLVKVQVNYPVMPEVFTLAKEL